jgi:hypothetical protein
MSTNDEHTSWRNWFGTIVVVASGLILAALISEAGILFTELYSPPNPPWHLPSGKDVTVPEDRHSSAVLSLS